jgi:hypothetical protein
MGLDIVVRSLAPLGDNLPMQGLLKKGTGYSVPSSKLLTSSDRVGVDRAACPLF